MTSQKPAKTAPQIRKMWKRLYQSPPHEGHTVRSEVMAIGTKAAKSGKMAQNTT